MKVNGYSQTNGYYQTPFDLARVEGRKYRFIAPEPGRVGGPHERPGGDVVAVSILTKRGRVPIQF
jgi:hypothetical protein